MVTIGGQERTMAFFNAYAATYASHSWRSSDKTVSFRNEPLQRCDGIDRSGSACKGEYRVPPCR